VAEQSPAGTTTTPAPSAAETTGRMLTEASHEVGAGLPFEAEPGDFPAALERLAEPRARR
jgi:hypothetical protein